MRKSIDKVDSYLPGYLRVYLNSILCWGWKAICRFAGVGSGVRYSIHPHKIFFWTARLLQKTFYAMAMVANYWRMLEEALILIISLWSLDPFDIPDSRRVQAAACLEFQQALIIILVWLTKASSWLGSPLWRKYCDLREKDCSFWLDYKFKL